jgi:MFS family permease
MTLFSNRFYRLWRCVGISNFTDGSLKIFLPFTALALASSPSEAAYTFTFLTLGWPLFGLLAGYIADRSRNEKLPFWSNLVRGFLFMYLAIAAWVGTLSLLSIYAIALAFSFCDVLFEVAVPRFIRSITTDENRIKANTRLAVTHTIASEFAGPILGAALSTLSPTLGLALISLLYLYSAYTLHDAANLDPSNHREAPGGSSFIKSLVEAFVWLFSNRILWRLSVVGFGMSVSWGTWLSLEPYYLIEQEPTSTNKLGFGTMMAILAAGAFSSALLLERVQLDRNKLSLLYIDTFGIVLLLIVSALSKNLFAIGAALFGTGVGATLWASIVITLRQEVIPLELMGRVNGLFRVITYGGYPLGSFMGGTLADILPIPSVYFFCALLSLFFSMLLLDAIRINHNFKLVA